MESCEHLQEVLNAHPKPRAQGCEECLATGGKWVQLRACLVCGHVGCCDSSPGKHATAHFHQTKHAVMQSFEPGATWGWCYVHERQLGPLPAAR
jgi:Zn-finger in ubiquitin-hydrolases and other protein